MKPQYLIAALAIVAGACSPALVKINPRPEPPCTLKDAVQMVELDSVAFSQVGRDYLDLNPCTLDVPGLQLVTTGPNLVSPAATAVPARFVRVTPSQHRQDVQAPAVDTSTHWQLDLTAIQTLEDSTTQLRTDRTSLRQQVVDKQAALSGAIRWIVFLGLGLLIFLSLTLYLAFKKSKL